MDKLPLIKKIFEEWNDSGISYCLLRNFDNLSENNDIDVLMMPDDVKRAAGAFDKLIKKYPLVKVEKKEGYHHFVHLVDPKSLELIAWDIQTALDYSGIIYFDAQKFLTERVRRKFFFIPPKGSEAVTLLLNRTFTNREIPDDYRTNIKNSLNDNYLPFHSFLGSIFGESLSSQIESYIKEDAWQKILDSRPVFIAHLRKKPLNFFREIKRRLTNLLSWIARRFGRRGIFVTLIGPDGVGKTTIAKNMYGLLKTLKIESRYLHAGFKMEGLPNLGKAIKKQRNSVVIEIARVFYHVASYLVGYWTKTWPRLLLKKEILISDRYYYDIVVNPSRKNIVLPDWFYRLFLFFVKQPDIVFLLEDDPGRIRKRKDELSEREIVNQMKKYRKLLGKMKKGEILDVSEGVKTSTQRAVGKILSRAGFTPPFNE